MSWQLDSGWMNENEWTAYPFTDFNPFSEQVADAQITVIGSNLEGRRLVITAVSSSGSSGTMSMSAFLEGDEQVVLNSVSAVITAYGEYQIWTVVSEDVEALFVVKPFSDSWSSVSWEVTSDAVIYPDLKQVLSISVYDPLTGTTSEVAGPGENFNLEAGSNTNLLARPGISDFQVTVSAIYSSTTPCSPGDWRVGSALATIGGVAPNVRGEMRLEGGRNYAIMRTGENELSIRNTSEACLDCEDYEELFLLIKELHEILETSYTEFLDDVEDSNSYVLRIQSLMNTDIVGMEAEE